MYVYKILRQPTFYVNSDFKTGDTALTNMCIISCTICSDNDCVPVSEKHKIKVLRQLKS